MFELKPLLENELQQVLNYKSLNYHRARAIDLFKFVYFSGTSVRDVLRFTESNFIGNNLSYTREKTKRKIVVPLGPEAMDIVNYYRGRARRSKYIFLDIPISLYINIPENMKSPCRLRKISVSEIDLLNESQCKRINHYLGEIGRELHLSIPLTAKVARKTCIHRLMQFGVPLDAIEELLGIGYKSSLQCFVKPEYNYREFMNYLPLKQE